MLKLPSKVNTNSESQNKNSNQQLHHIDDGDENGAKDDKVLCYDVNQTQLTHRRHKRCHKKENNLMDPHGILVNISSDSNIITLPSNFTPTTTTFSSLSSLSSSGSKSSNTTTFINNCSRSLKDDNSKIQVSHEKHHQQKTSAHRKKEQKQKLKCEAVFHELNGKSTTQSPAIEELLQTPPSHIQCHTQEQQQDFNQLVKYSQGSDDTYSKQNL